MHVPNGYRYLDSAESRTDHDAQLATPRPAMELPVSDLQPISDARSIPRSSDGGGSGGGHSSPDGPPLPEASAISAIAAPTAPAPPAAAHPFVFDAFRAVRLAKTHGKLAAARRILVELNAFEAAIELAETYAEGLSVVEEVSPTNAMFVVICSFCGRTGCACRHDR